MPSSAHKKRSTLGLDQLVDDIGLVAEALSQLAVETVRRPSSGCLVTEGGEVPLASRHRGGADEQSLVRHVDGVGGGAVERLLSSVNDPRARGGKKAIGVLDARDGPSGSGAAGSA